MIYREPKLSQFSWVCPRGPAKSFPKLSNSPLPWGKKKYQNCTISPGFPTVPRGLTHGKANDKCKTETAYRRESNMNMWASRCPKWNLDDSCCGACWLTLKRQPMNIDFLIEENKQTNVTWTRETLKKMSKTGACRMQLAVYFLANILISFQHNTKKTQWFVSTRGPVKQCYRGRTYPPITRWSWSFNTSRKPGCINPLKPDCHGLVQWASHVTWPRWC